jgi:hypothetical protein
VRLAYSVVVNSRKIKIGLLCKIDCDAAIPTPVTSAIVATTNPTLAPIVG